MTKSVNWSPLVIILLLAALVATVSQLVIQKADQQPTQLSENSKQQKHYEWRMVTTWPKGLPGLGLAAENFARIVEQSSNGRLKVKVYGAGDLVPALGVFDAVSSGSVEMGHGAAYYWKGKIPASPFFTSVPFGMNAQEMNGWLFYGGGLELYREAYAPFNLMPFPAGNTGVQMAGWFNKEINTIDDIQGTKMRIPGLAGEVWNRAGGVAVNIPGGELYTALQTGVIDATEWVGPYNDLALGFHQVAKYYYYPGWHEPGPTLELLVNKNAFESLPKDLQSIVESAARVVNQDMLDEYTARNNAALKTLISEHGVQLRPLPKEVLQELRKHADAMYSEFAAKDPFFAKVYKHYRSFADQVAQYHDISEQAYYEANE
ncbi:TRAP transporter substrate-binding protein [Pseudoteredinibacter isoporae]|uniref:TRAP transporter substrate-binding protein n=1 Tax=Pseudoteredinibacter isoporae TaxID=570281 RepID=UPI00141F6C05|nr:TRAP transporter substrate-binding protein DctP [Pseudoteredinibacter isoporae]NHO85853.1 ABC transporter substrate-binding protein [Pseudoteredinibacter isoporae]NIB25695.1 TRAP transporter substrate-binding protein DctP [Pseudoteredinibacter isoporae]